MKSVYVLEDFCKNGGLPHIGSIIGIVNSK